MRKKPKKDVNEVLHPEIERHLPVKPIAMPSLDELNKLMERMLQEERRRARRESAIIVAGLSLIFVLILAGVVWFTHDVMQQLKQERRLSEKSREDLLGLIYSGHLAAMPTPEAQSAARVPDRPVPAPSTGDAAPAPQPVPTDVPPPADATADAAPAAPPPAPPAAPSAWRAGLEARILEDLILRLPIPPPQ